MARRISLRKYNVFRTISEGRTENERKYFDKLVAERIDPVTGEAHFYKVTVRKNRTNYQITIPRTEWTKQQFPSLENNDEVKILTQREKDRYIVLKEYDEPTVPS